jgi:membrane associated rhomboid family serine protease
VSEIVDYIKQTNIVERIILLTILLFIVGLFSPTFIDQLVLPASFHDFFSQPWSVIAYPLIHTKLVILIVNLIVLFYIGNLFLDFHSIKQFSTIFILGVVISGVSFLLYHYFFTDSGDHLYLSGLSYGITAIFTAIVIKIPTYQVQIRFIGGVKLVMLLSIWLGLNILGAISIDMGMVIAQVGAVLVGFLSERFSFIKFSTANRNKTQFKKVYKNPTVSTRKSYRQKKDSQDEIDRILDKISKKGYQKLTQEEKEFLFQQGNYDKG